MKNSQEIEIASVNDKNNQKMVSAEVMDFNEFRQLYKGMIEDKCKEEYGDVMDSLLDDVAMEMYLQSKHYIPENKKLKEAKEPFSGIEFEKKLPSNMRFKDYDVIDTTKLYWVTQEPFTRSDIDKFVEAFKETPFGSAYITVRDLSTYDYNVDYTNNVLVHIDKVGNVFMDNYIDKMNKAGLGAYLEESKKVSKNDDLTQLANDIIDFFDSDMGTHFDEIQNNEEEIFNKTMSILENKDGEEIKNLINQIREADIDEKTAREVNIKSSENLVKRLNNLTENKKLQEDYYTDVTKEDLSNIRDIIESMIEAMDDSDKKELRLKPNTYGMHSMYISLPSRGFLPLDIDYVYDNDEDDLYENKDSDKKEDKDKKLLLGSEEDFKDENPNVYWLDSDTLMIDFGYKTDEEGENYTAVVEYWVNDDTYHFLKQYDYDTIIVDVPDEILNNVKNIVDKKLKEGKIDKMEEALTQPYELDLLKEFNDMIATFNEKSNIKVEKEDELAYRGELVKDDVSYDVAFLVEPLNTENGKEYNITYYLSKFLPKDMELRFVTQGTINYKLDSRDNKLKGRSLDGEDLDKFIINVNKEVE